METQPFDKMYLLLNMVNFHCHDSFQGVHESLVFASSLFLFHLYYTRSIKNTSDLTAKQQKVIGLRELIVWQTG